MAKYILISVFIFLAGLKANAQITISQYNHPSPANEKTGLQPVKTKSLPLPKAAADTLWDYSSLTDSSPVQSTQYFAPADSAFKGATRAFYNAIGTGLLTVLRTTYDLNDTNGYAHFGYAVETDQKISLSFLTGNPGDSVVFPPQKQFLKPLQYEIKYPATYKSSWRYTGRFATDFTMYLLDYQLKDSPVVRITNRTTIDTVIGWGKMMVPYNNDSVRRASDKFDVLLVKETNTDKDSFYVNGHPATAFQLGAIGFKNPEITETINYYFYRPGFSAPLLCFSTDSNNKKTLSAGYDTNTTAPAVSGISSFSTGANNVKIYPNPVTGCSFHFKSGMNNESAKIEISNSLGQLVASQKISGPKENIILPAGIGEGLYFYEIKSQSGKIAAGKFIVLR